MIIRRLTSQSHQHIRHHALHAHRPRYASSSSPKKVVIGIRREDPSRIWERRCPVTPELVRELVEESEGGVEVHVQPCDRRVWGDGEFEKAGAHLRPVLNDAHILVGIKETPLSELITTPTPPPPSASPTTPPTPDARTHIMFSHTAKGQPYNTPLLSRFLSHHPNHPHHPFSKSAQAESRLIDFELLTDEKEKGGKRTVGFGWYAGVAGVVESLCVMAGRHLKEGVASPFLTLPRTSMHADLAALRVSLRQIGKQIAENGTPGRLGPMVFCVTGTGNVAQGCHDILKELPVEYVKAEDLPRLVADPATSLKKIYITSPLPADYFVRNDGGKFEREHYYANPSMYTSVFNTKVYPYVTLLLNGAGWAPGFPRIMSIEDLRNVPYTEASVAQMRGKVVGDISCDVEGGIEFLTHSTTLCDPSFVYTLPPSSWGRPATDVTVMAVDILPTALPLDASRHFSSKFADYLRQSVSWYAGATTGGAGAGLSSEKAGEMQRALDRATIAREGRLMEGHEWLGEAVQKWRVGQGASVSASSSTNAATTSSAASSSTSSPVTSESDSSASSKGFSKKKVLLLGSGMVAGPAVEVLAAWSEDVSLLIATNSVEEAQALTSRYANVAYKIVDVTDPNAIGALVSECDLAISLLPVSFHPSIAKLCVEHKKNLVTASYISPQMKELHESALASDVLLLNEIGLDPGIDHCSAIKLINDIRTPSSSHPAQTIRSFTSFCGGLPAPECREGTAGLGYKFSWSPRGVLSAALNGARYKLGGKIHEVAPGSLLQNPFPTVPILSNLAFEGLPNRDSIPYASTYALGDPAQDTLRTCLRGTLRYPGFSKLMSMYESLGLLNDKEGIHLRDWSTLIRQSVMAHTSPSQTPIDLTSLLATNPDLAESMRYLGLLPDSDVEAYPGLGRGMPEVPRGKWTPIDLFSRLLAWKLRYAEGERDMVVLSHEIVTSDSIPSQSSQSQSSQPTSSTIHTSTLISLGSTLPPSQGGHTAMARTVGIPVALAALQILSGRVSAKGVQGPGVEREIWEGVLGGMEERGLGMVERVRRVEGNGNGDGRGVIEGGLGA